MSWVVDLMVCKRGRVRIVNWGTPEYLRSCDFLAETVYAFYKYVT